MCMWIMLIIALCLGVLKFRSIFLEWFASAIASGLSEIEAREYALGMTEGGLRLMM